jgi:cystathionine beta-lyase
MFDDLRLEALHQRRSAKWAVYPPDVLPAWVAEMDYPLAPPLKAALHAAIERDDCGYPREGDLPAAFVAFAREAFDWTVDPARTFLVPDVMVGVGETLRLLTAPGSAVAINTPVYPPFFGVPKEVERHVEDVPLLAGDAGWTLDLDRLEHAFARGVKTYLLCNPHNPVGRAFTRAELEAVADLAQQHGVLVISDEIHAPLMMPGVTHTPFTQVAEPRGVECVVLTSASKAWNIAGLKCALLISGAPRLTSVPAEVRYRSGILGVAASIAAFREGDAWRRETVAQLDRNRRRLAELLQAHLPQVRYRMPEASYLAWLDCTGLGLGEDPATVFLRRGRVALSRGRDFGGEPYAGFVRLNFATSPAILEQIVDRMRTSLVPSTSSG